MNTPNPSELFKKYLNNALNVRKCITKSALAKASGISRSQIDDYLGGRNPTIESLGKIAKALDVQPWELIKPENAIGTPTPIARGLSPLDALKIVEKALKEGQESAPIPADILSALSNADDELLSDVRTIIGLAASEALKKPKLKSKA